MTQQSWLGSRWDNFFFYLGLCQHFGRRICGISRFADSQVPRIPFSWQALACVLAPASAYSGFRNYIHPHGLQRLLIFLYFSGPWTNWPQMAPNGARNVFFPANPELADIFGDTEFDFENFYFLGFFWYPRFPDFQVPNFQISRNLAWASLGPSLGLGPLGWAPRLGLGVPRLGRGGPRLG